MNRARSAGRGLLGTWVKIPALDTVELLAHGGFDFVVMDMEHAPLALDRVTAASEVGQKGVRVNCVMPGAIETPLLIEVIEQLFQGDVQKGRGRLGQVATLDRCGKPEGVGNVVSFLLSDAASYVNGAKWEIDGGALATIRNDI